MKNSQQIIKIKKKFTHWGEDWILWAWQWVFSRIINGHQEMEDLEDKLGESSEGRFSVLVTVIFSREERWRRNWDRRLFPVCLNERSHYQVVVEMVNPSSSSDWLRLFTTMAVLWTVNDFFYVAGTLNAENLSGDIFINFSLISLTEMPSVFIGQFLIGKFSS